MKINFVKYGISTRSWLILRLFVTYIWRKKGEWQWMKKLMTMNHKYLNDYYWNLLLFSILSNFQIFVTLVLCRGSVVSILLVYIDSLVLNVSPLDSIWFYCFIYLINFYYLSGTHLFFMNLYWHSFAFP